MGWIYRKIQDRFCESSRSVSASLCEQGFISAVRNEMHDYYRLVAILESHLSGGKTGGGSSFQKLSLKRLWVWTHAPLQRLRIIGVLMDVCRDVRGGALISIIHNYAVHGDPAIKEYLTRMLHKVTIPC